MNIALIGMMGAGKTTVGKALAKELGFLFVDTDEEIVRAHGEIAQIFSLKGEEYFRGLESELVKTLAKKDGLVISTGGGLPLLEENRRLLKMNGFIVYLRASAETIEKRLRTDCTRPLLQSEGLSLYETIEGLLAVRKGIYEAFADITVDTDGKVREVLLKELVEKIKGAGTK